MNDDTMIPCPMERRPRGSGIGGAALTACLYCGQVNASTSVTDHRPIPINELRDRLVKADDYDLVIAERDHARTESARLSGENHRLDSMRVSVEEQALRDMNSASASIISLNAQVAQLREQRDRERESADNFRARTRRLEAENKRLRTLVSGVQRAIESVLTDRQTDLRPPASVILSTVVRHLKEATDGWTGEAGDQTERGELAGEEVGPVAERVDGTDG